NGGTNTLSISSAGTAAIYSNAGNNVINALLDLSGTQTAHATILQAADGASLTINGNMTGANKSVSVDSTTAGTDGTGILAGRNSYSGATTINGTVSTGTHVGALRIGAANALSSAKL